MDIETLYKSRTKKNAIPLAALKVMSGAALRKLVPTEWLAFYPGAEIVRRDDYRFYLYDGMMYNIATGSLEDE